MGALSYYFMSCAFKLNFVAHLIIFSSVFQVDGVNEPIRKEFSQNGFLVNMNC